MKQSQGKFLILKKTRYSEADLILAAIGDDGVKKSFIARGALKSRKRFGGGLLEPTHHLLLHYRLPTRGGELHVLESAQLLKDFKGLRSDYEKLESALLAVDLIQKISLEGAPALDHYNLLGHFLTELDSSRSWQALKTQFYLKVLNSEGVLDPEAWMKDFLVVSMKKHQELEGRSSELLSKMNFLESLARNYAKTAESL